MKLIGRAGGCGCLTLIVLGLGLLGTTYPAEFIVLMLFGWGLYLYRVVPKIQIDGGGVLIALLCLTGFTIGLHAFLVWIARNWRNADATPAPWIWKRRWTATVVVSVLLLFTSGIAATGIVHQTGWLLRSREPLITAGASALDRTHASRQTTSNKLAWHRSHTIN